jgi:hypothetical protein
MILKGKRIRSTRLVRTDLYIVAVDVEAVIPDADPSEPCYEPETVEFLRQVEIHARGGDLEWLRSRGKVYSALDAA